jgi:putative heme-binding domain-containing protein
MARSGVRETPAAWVAGLVAALEGNEFEIGAEAVRTMRRLPAVKEQAESITRALLLAARNRDFAPEIRLEALASVPGQIPVLPPALFRFVLENLASDQPVRNRAAAAQVVQKARLTTAELRELVRHFNRIGPMELPKILAAFEPASEEALGRELLEGLRRSSAGSSLREELLKPNLKNFPEPIQNEADAWLISLDSDLAEKGKYLEELLNTLPSGDIRNGQAIFNSPQAACAACHAIGYLGGNLGPDLTNIGTIRTGRDLLESIVFPSASFTRSYETVLITTGEGEEHSGILRGESSDEIRLATGPGVEMRIAREEITGMRPGAVSLMPGGLHEQLNAQELADLLAFLKNTRWGAN